MRKSRQPRCTAANRPTATLKGAEAAGGRTEFGVGDKWRIANGYAVQAHAAVPDGTKLSKRCPLREPRKQAAGRARCLIFDLELLDVGGLRLRRLDPFLHLRQRHDHV